MLSKFHNVSLADLADQAGALDTEIKARQEQLDELKDELKRREVNCARGTRFMVTVSESTSKRLDTTRLKADLGDALAPYQTETTSTRVLIKPVPQMDAEAA